VSAGPRRVAFQWVRSAVGKAEMPGVGEVMRAMSSDWRLRRLVGLVWFGLASSGEVEVYRLMTLPLAGAADLEPCAVEGAVEVAIVRMCRYCLMCKARCRDKRMSPFVFYEVIECWRGFVRGEESKRMGWSGSIFAVEYR
jgi:hypothetical protein